MRCSRILCVGTLLLSLTAAHATDNGFKPNSNGSVTAPDGLIWYPTIKNSDGNFANMNQKQAVICCNAGPRIEGFPMSCPFGANGAYLPTAQEFDTLGKQLGNGTPKGYDPSPIPNLAETWYWASRGPGSPISHYAFMSDKGSTANWDPMYSFWVRCVGRKLDMPIQF